MRTTACWTAAQAGQGERAHGRQDASRSRVVRHELVELADPSARCAKAQHAELEGPQLLHAQLDELDSEKTAGFVLAGTSSSRRLLLASSVTLVVSVLLGFVAHRHAAWRISADKSGLASYVGRPMGRPPSAAVTGIAPSAVLAPPGPPEPLQATALSRVAAPAPLGAQLARASQSRSAARRAQSLREGRTRTGLDAAAAGDSGTLNREATLLRGNVAAAHAVAAPSTPREEPNSEAQPIDDELALLGAAQEALRNGQPTLVLRLVEHHAFRFPRGALTRERIAVQMLALCALNRGSEARQMLAELTERAAASPLLERVRRRCGL